MGAAASRTEVVLSGNTSDEISKKNRMSVDRYTITASAFGVFLRDHFVDTQADRPIRMHTKRFATHTRLILGCGNLIDNRMGECATDQLQRAPPAGTRVSQTVGTGRTNLSQLHA